SDARRVAGTSEGGGIAGASVCLGGGIPALGPIPRDCLSDRRYPHAGNVWSGIAGQAERRALQDSNHLHHGTRRRKNANAGLESRCSGVHGKAVRRRSSARECSSSFGELSSINELARRQEVLSGSFRKVRE